MIVYILKDGRVEEGRVPSPKISVNQLVSMELSEVTFPGAPIKKGKIQKSEVGIMGFHFNSNNSM